MVEIKHITNASAGQAILTVAFLFAVLALINVVAGLSPSKKVVTSDYENCQSGFLLATKAVVDFNKAYPKYKITLPDYDCNALLEGTHSTGTTVLPPKGQVSYKKSKTNNLVVSVPIVEKKVAALTVSGGTSASNYWEAYEKAIKLIQKYEGLRLKAYPDYAGCSIGWGTRASSCKEVITQAEADKRLANIVKTILADVRKNFPKANSSRQAGLVSFAYNCHKGWVDIKVNGLSRHSLWCKTVTVKGKVKKLPGLVKRRKEEATLIF